MQGLEVGLLLWRAQLQMFLNQTIRSGKPGRIAGTIIAAAVIVLAWAWEALVTWLAIQAAHRVPVRFDDLHLLSLAFLAYTAVLVFSSLVFSFNALLLNPDLDLLLAAPRPVESILAGRMVVQVLRLFLLSLLFTAPALIVLAVANHNALIPIGFAALYLLYPVYVVVIISLLSLLLVRFIPVGRGREILTLFGVVPPRRRQTGSARGRRLKGALPLIHPVLAAIVVKDWRMRTRDLAQLVRFAMPVAFLFIIFGLRFPRLLSSVRSLGEGPAAAMLGLIPAWVLLFSLSISLGLTAVSLEGPAIWVFAASPNTTLRLLQGKCWSTALPTTAVVAVRVGLLGALLPPPRRS